MTKSFVPVRQDPDKMRFIEWLTTPPDLRDPPTEREFAVLLDVHSKTLFNWKQEREFRDVWHASAEEVIGGDEGSRDRRQRILDVLYEAASDPRNPRHVQAAKQWADMTKAISPGAMSTDGGPLKAVGMLTDDELERFIARGVAELQQGQ
jgi:hypothetical protein